MDRFEAMRIFVAVAEGESFAAAARALGLSGAAVTRAVAALEARLGTLLLHRTTRIVRPTEAGQLYLADCKRLLSELDAIESTASGTHADLKGGIAVTASVMFGRLYVTPLILKFLDTQPLMRVRALLLDRVVDLIEEGIDVAVRIAPPRDSSLMAVRVGRVSRVVCASPAYLEKRGTPLEPGDLTGHDAILFGAAATQEWTFADNADLRRLRLTARFAVNASDAQVDAAIAGHGIIQALSYQVASALADGRLVRLMPQFEPPPVPISIVHAEGRRTQGRLRAFVDYAVEALRADPALGFRD